MPGTPTPANPTATPPVPPPAQVPPAGAPGQSGMMMLAIGVVVVAGLYFGREVIIPIALAVLLSFVLAPLVDLLRRARLGRVPSVVIAVVLALGIILLLGGVIGTQVAGLAADLPRYQATIAEKVNVVRSATIGRVTALLSRFDGEAQQPGSAPPAAKSSRRGSASAPASSPTEQASPQVLRQAELSPLDFAKNILSPILSPLATTGIVIVIAIFILLQQDDLRDRLIRLFGSSDLHRTTAAMDDAARRLSKYFLTQLGLNTLFGVIVAVGLWFIGVPSPVLWGIFGALMRFIPYVGSFISGIIPVVLAAAVDPGWSMMLWTAALFLVTEPIMGQAIEPMVYGHSTGLSPFAVVVAAIFWTWLWGAIGLILSTPLTLCLVVLGRHVERLEFLDVILGDRPALTPVESFYQRMLAGDLDEVLEHAELLLGERSLTAYYDEVALQGLRLAANDAERGVLSHEQLERFRQAVLELVRDLSDREDVDPPRTKAREAAAAEPLDRKALAKEPAPEGGAPAADELAPAWRGGTPVMCVAGRGPLDEAASEMLAQLLGKHGLGARVVPHDAVSRAKIGSLDMTGVAMVCISYVEISGNPAHLRYLLHRLRLHRRRQRLPNAPILVGLWPSDDAVLTDPNLRARTGADYYVETLRDAVMACLAVAHGEADRAAAPESHAAAPAAGVVLPPAEPAVPEMSSVGSS